MSLDQELRASGQAFFDAFAANTPPIKMLHHFSTSSPAVLQHTPLDCPHPFTSKLSGSNALRSYFDLLATNWTRSNAHIRDELEVDASNRRVVIPASVTWTWKRSGRHWREDFTWTLDFDDTLKISSFVIRTMSGPGTCVMRAVDIDPVATDKKMFAQAAL
ncbi:hypothetical protein BDN70DRAFT_876717 [Pholiota conissans]|uniref:Uncharacterized protein n=1 Tax=Pholiota conissans TaxID=109636 RepID=A0A9P5Z4S2_9AGAR|nr:hypothetical protein BDN70DRAFT_876717 [Pholiota conissans]